MVNGDREAIKSLIVDFQCRVQTLDADLHDFYMALDGPPGALTELADEIRNRDWYVDGVDIRDLLPEPSGRSADRPT